MWQTILVRGGWAAGVLLGLAACGGGGGDGAVASAPAVSGGGQTTTAKPAPTPTPGGSSCTMDSTRQAMLQLVNQARANSRQCGGQSYPAVPALAWSCKLEAVALSHAQDMGSHNFFSHTGSNGLNVGQRVSNAGYSWSAVGENIAAGQPTAEAVVQGWLNSPGHCSNIMSGNFTEMGQARYDVSGSDYPVYWTQVLAKPR